ncbi:hypothetical protein FOA43_000936 [Brettanomyces nanus]|uniref:Uncharacterized protein n=1 Tax=Eeniella nana TaxID=13502 RepID=A0A875S2R0_EENNA|nr:uncharacterized protein FOA43_000936 [Brettanomyces nanus]QPG73624.1 hypothetical protein FOA43_000936 [Brettanomyces nanus]
MFARQKIETAARFGVKMGGIRLASSANFANKVTGFVNCATYWTKVTGEVAKQVYTKEGFAPPKSAEFKQLYDNTVEQSLSFVKSPKSYTVSVVRAAQNFSSNDFFRYSCYLIQILGCFALGEIIGRRNFVGYPKYGPKTN